MRVVLSGKKNTAKYFLVKNKPKPCKKFGKNLKKDKSCLKVGGEVCTNQNQRGVKLAARLGGLRCYVRHGHLNPHRELFRKVIL